MLGRHVVTVTRLRGDVVEAVHRVRTALWTSDNTTGDGREPVWLRSAAKSFQAVPLLATGADRRFGLAARHVALACASHNGEPRHVAVARETLRLAGVELEALRCGSHRPLHGPSDRALACSGESESALHNNCSGKHAGMLAACVAAGWDRDGYLETDHPLQRSIRDVVAAASGVDAPEIRTAVDGCSVPVFAVPLVAAARMFAALATPGAVPLPKAVSRHLLSIAAAQRAAPWMVGGTGRADTALIRATGGRMLSKVGAEGLWSIGVGGTGVGLALKCEDGSSAAAYRAGLAWLRAAGGLADRAFAALRPHHDSTRRNHAGLVVGHVRADVPPPLVDALRRALTSGTA